MHDLSHKVEGLTACPSRLQGTRQQRAHFSWGNPASWYWHSCQHNGKNPGSISWLYNTQVNIKVYVFYSLQVQCLSIVVDPWPAVLVTWFDLSKAWWSYFIYVNVLFNTEIVQYHWNDDPSLHVITPPYCVILGSKPAFRNQKSSIGV